MSSELLAQIIGIIFLMKDVATVILIILGIRWVIKQIKGLTL